MTPVTSQQELQLSGDLRQIVAAPPFVPDVEAIVRRGRRQRRRGLALRGTAALGITVAAGLVGLASVNHAGLARGGSARAGSAPGAAAPAPAAQTAAYVTAHAEAALKGASRYLIRTTVHGYPGGVIHELTDPRTAFSYNVQGTGASKVESWGGSYFTGKVLRWRDVEADFGSRTWFRRVTHGAGPVPGPLPEGPKGPAVPGGSPAQIRQWLGQGFYQLVGHGTVDGHQATHLRSTVSAVTTDLWVDSQSFRTVRVVTNSSPGAPRGHTVRFDESWIPRSAALVQLANHPRIPAGFTRVPPPA